MLGYQEFRVATIVVSFSLASWAGTRAISAEPEPNFIKDVVPVLTKAGCNAGACHGSFQGRGGFRLSLLGVDPAADYEAIFKGARGRRVSLGSPESSLLMQKALGAVPHGGGRRIEASS